MKKLLLACSLIGFMSVVHAQPAQHEHAFDPAERAVHLQKTLQLSDDQTAKVKKIFEDSAQQHKALEDKYKPQLEAFHADAQKLHEQTHAQLNGVLTPKQQQALEAQHHSHHGKKWGDDKDPAHDHGDKAPK